MQMDSKIVIEDLEKLIELNTSIVTKLTELIQRVEKLISDCLIARTTGVSVAAVGTSMVIGGWIAGLVLAVPTFGASLTIPAVMTIAGTTTAVAGGLTAAGTEIANGIISKQFLDELVNIQDEHKSAAKKTEESLRQIQFDYNEREKDENEINGHSTGNIVSGSIKVAGAATSSILIGASAAMDDVTIAAFRSLGIGTSSAILQGTLRGVVASLGIVFSVIDIVRLVKDYTDPNPLLKELERIKQLYLLDIDTCEELILIFKKI